MRLHILSDLHMEFARMPRDYAPPECDVVILAGDIATGVQGIMWAQDTFGCPVLYVPGNHEWYGKRRYARHLEKMREKAEGSQVGILHNDAIFGTKVRFLGATLWTDFDLYGTPDLSRLVAARQMNDYVAILRDAQKPLTVADTIGFHQYSRFWLSEELRKPFPGKTVVISHHAPSALSIAEKWRSDPCSPAFASRMENLILDTAPALWVHGHTHASCDYAIGETRVLCNPRGYGGAHHDLNPDFDPQLVVEV
jgi:hypothetical protein